MNSLSELNTQLDNSGGFGQSRIEEKIIKYKKLTYLYGLSGFLFFAFSIGLLRINKMNLTELINDKDENKFSSNI